MHLDLDLLKTIRESIDWLLTLPDKLVEAVVRPMESIDTARRRIALLRELAELDEVAKSVTDLYWSKGSIVAWVEAIQKSNSLEDAQYLRDLFLDAALGIRGIRDTLKATTIGSAVLTAEASLLLARAETAYIQLANMPREAILRETSLVEIIIKMELLIASGLPLLSRLDDCRRIIRGHHGGFIEDEEIVSAEIRKPPKG